MNTRLNWCWLLLAGEVDADFSYTEQYAAKRSDYYLRRAKRASGSSCSRLLEAALDISPRNETVSALVANASCPMESKPLGHASLQVGPILSWATNGTPGAECPTPEGAKVSDIFPTPVGFVHASELGLKDWKKTINHLRSASIRRFKEVHARAKGRDRNFVNVNNHFFKQQITDPEEAMSGNPGAWPEMYNSKEYAEWAQAAKNVCVSYARKLGVSLSAQEEAEMHLVLWTAVYPGGLKKDPVTHYYHAHQESIVSFVLFASMPEPTTPLTLADPRGLPPTEDYEFFQDKGDLGVDAEPPFHRTVEFFAGDGDILVFPSYEIHKVPPHVGKGTRVVWPANCELPKRHSESHAESLENPWDGWQRYVFWPVQGLPGHSIARPHAVQSYKAHAEAALELAYNAEDPYMKLWETQNQILAMLQFAPQDPRIWIDAGNATARAAVLLAARGEGNYFADAAAFLVRGLRLDSAVSSSLKTLFKELSPKQPSPRLREGFKMAKQLSKMVKKMYADPESEFIQFLHEDLNGPTKCSRICPISREAPIKAMRILSMFSTRVVVAPYERDDDVMRIGEQMLGGIRGELIYGVNSDCWRRDSEASLSGLHCSADISVWFADPRGIWPERWRGAVHSGPMKSPWATAVNGDCPGSSMLAAEPKAPFHHHSVVDCSAGQFIIFPAWLAYRLAPGNENDTRPFTIRVAAGGGHTFGWRMPVVQPHCLAPRERHREQDEL